MTGICPEVQVKIDLDEYLPEKDRKLMKKDPKEKDDGKDKLHEKDLKEKDDEKDNPHEKDLKEKDDEKDNPHEKYIKEKVNEKYSLREKDLKDEVDPNRKSLSEKEKKVNRKPRIRKRKSLKSTVNQKKLPDEKTSNHHPPMIPPSPEPTCPDPSYP